MANTYSQLHVQIVFPVQGRQNLLLKPWREELFKYISGIISGLDHKSLIVNGVEDHIHAFVGLNPSKSISSLVKELKVSSSNFIKANKFIKGTFSWQTGYGAFSYSRSQVKDVYNYILNQEEHHKKVTFKEEYITFLKNFEIEYDEKYLFDWIDLSFLNKK